MFMVISFVTVGQALAGDRDPGCLQPSVVVEMTREIRDHDYYGKIDPARVTETPTDSTNMVWCLVCVQSAPYDTIRFGEQPIRECREHGFRVAALSYAI
jgi:hypothetical protein